MEDDGGRAGGSRAAVGLGIIPDVDEVRHGHVQPRRHRIEGPWIGFSPATLDARHDGVERVRIERGPFEGSARHSADATVREDADGTHRSSRGDRLGGGRSGPNLWIEGGHQRVANRVTVVRDLDPAALEGSRDMVGQGSFHALGDRPVRLSVRRRPVLGDGYVSSFELDRDRAAGIGRSRHRHEGTKQIEAGRHVGVDPHPSGGHV